MNWADWLFIGAPVYWIVGCVICWGFSKVTERRASCAPVAKLIISLIETRKGWHPVDSWLGPVAKHVAGVRLFRPDFPHTLSVKLNDVDLQLNPYWRRRISAAWVRMEAKKQDEASAEQEIQFADNVVSFLRKGR